MDNMNKKEELKYTFGPFDPYFQIAQPSLLKIKFPYNLTTITNMFL